MIQVQVHFEPSDELLRLALHAGGRQEKAFLHPEDAFRRAMVLTLNVAEVLVSIPSQDVSPHLLATGYGINCSLIQTSSQDIFDKHAF